MYDHPNTGKLQVQTPTNGGYKLPGKISREN